MPSDMGCSANGARLFKATSDTVTFFAVPTAAASALDVVRLGLAAASGNSRSVIKSHSWKAGPRATSPPVVLQMMLLPSKTSSSCPPTVFT